MNVVPVSVQKKTKINYFTTSRTINSDYKKIKKEVLVVAAEETAIFFDNEPCIGWSHSRKTSTIDIQTKEDVRSKDDICILKLG